MLQSPARQLEYRGRHKLPFSTKPLTMPKILKNETVDYRKDLEKKDTPYTQTWWTNPVQKIQARPKRCYAQRCKGDCLRELSVLWKDEFVPEVLEDFCSYNFE